MNYNDMVAQLAHFAWGALLMVTLAPYTDALWRAAVSVLVIATAKELSETLWGVWEPRQTWGSCFEDMIFWSMGILAGVVLVLR